MRAYVYTDKSLERYAGRFVWLSVNTEDAKNAAFLKKYPIPALPTTLVLDPSRDAVVLRYIGGANVQQVRSMLDDAEKTYQRRAQSPADKLLARADDAASKGKHADSAMLFRQAMAAAPKNWPKYGRAAESLVFALSMADAYADCAYTAAELYPRVKGTVSSANVASTGLTCALIAKRTPQAEMLEKATREVFDDPRIVLSEDDRSGLYSSLVDAEEDPAAKRKLQEEWIAFLEGAAARAKTPLQRAVFDSARVYVYIQLGTPEKAIPMLEQSEREFPDDYNPPSRMASAYRAMKEHDKALAATDRALARVEGPRRLSVLSNRGSIYLDKGDTKAAKATFEEALAYAKSLPEGQRSDSWIQAIERRLASLK